MMLRTHLAFGLLCALFFVQNVNNKAVFIIAAMFAVLLPDIDSIHSYAGKFKILRPFQIFIKHRGMLHSLTFCFAISLFFALFIPILAAPFFIGYASHLIIDSFTIEGVRPFWPFKSEWKGPVRTGSYAESLVFVFLIITDIFIFLNFII